MIGLNLSSILFLIQKSFIVRQSVDLQPVDMATSWQTKVCFRDLDEKWQNIKN